MRTTIRLDDGRYTVRPTGQGGLRHGVDLSSNASVTETMHEGESLDTLR
ncbi:hypothetical protein ACAG26_12610 [Mycobacterium sp. pUA109]